MRRLRFVLGSLGVGLGLACGGVAGGGSPGAVALCEHLAVEEEHPCVSHAVGSSVVIDGIEVSVDRVATWTGKSSLPEIGNMTERSRMKKVDNHALVVEVSFTNTKPVKSEVDFVAYLMNGDGEEAFVQPYNARLYMKDKEGWIDLWDDDVLGPGKTRQTALVYAVPASAVEGSYLILRKNEKKPDPKDPRGRMKSFVVELNVLDLPLP